MKYMHSADIAATEMDGAIILLNTRSWQIYNFDPVAAAIWRALKQPATLAMVVDQLAQIYDIKPVQCASDTESFLSEMIEQGNITIVP